MFTREVAWRWVSEPRQSDGGVPVLGQLNMVYWNPRIEKGVYTQGNGPVWRIRACVG